MLAKSSWGMHMTGEVSRGRRMVQLLVVVGLLSGIESAAEAAALCVRATLTGALILRPACRVDEIQIGTFDGTVLQFSGINVQIVDGSGETGGAPNGLGNLIVGYNEDSNPPNDRAGSHNVVIGPEHTYSSFGGLVAGHSNTISGAHAVVSGGSGNEARGENAVVSGGGGNMAFGPITAVSGGALNLAQGPGAAVSGGQSNRAIGEVSVVSGGLNNETTGLGFSAVVSGGRLNTASGFGAVISGGQDNRSTGPRSTVSGGRNNTARGSFSAVSGGQFNTAGVSASFSTVSGGASRSVSRSNNWRAGGLFQEQ